MLTIPMLDPNQKKEHVAVFLDMDGTVLRKESQFHFLIWNIRRGLVNRRQVLNLMMRYLLYTAGITSDAQMLREKGFMLMQGLRSSDVEQEVTSFLKVFISEVRPGAPSLIAVHREQGHVIVLVTSAMDVLARQVGRMLGIEHVIATHLQEEHGLYTGRYEQPSPWGEGKQRLVEQYCQHHHIAPENCHAYGDHISDLPMLEYIGRPTVVHPHRLLARIAREKHWPIMYLD